MGELCMARVGMGGVVESQSRSPVNLASESDTLDPNAPQT